MMLNNKAFKWIAVAAVGIVAGLFVWETASTSAAGGYSNLVEIPCSQEQQDAGYARCFGLEKVNVEKDLGWCNPAQRGHREVSDPHTFIPVEDFRVFVYDGRTHYNDDGTAPNPYSEGNPYSMVENSVQKSTRKALGGWVDCPSFAGGTFGYATASTKPVPDIKTLDTPASTPTVEVVESTATPTPTVEVVESTATPTVEVVESTATVEVNECPSDYKHEHDGKEHWHQWSIDEADGQCKPYIGHNGSSYHEH